MKLIKLSFWVCMVLFCAGYNSAFAQSSNCATATTVTLAGNPTCVGGTNLGASYDNTLYGGCNAGGVDMVWYTYVTSGTSNTIKVTPGSMRDPEIVFYLGGCPFTGGTLQICNTSAGAAPVSTLWGVPVGTQVWVGVASTSGIDGSFTLCITSVTAPAVGGQTCAVALPICLQSTYTLGSMAGMGSSGQTSSCFGSPVQQDIFLKFTVYQTGLLAWNAMGNSGATEYDWAIWDITSGCPGTEFCCNYNYAAGSSMGFGMENLGNPVPCGYNIAAFDPTQEFTPPKTVTVGHTYALQISNYSNDNNGFKIDWTGSTCLIAPVTAFSVSPNTFTCAANVNVTVTNTSVGSTQTWDWGDGSANYIGAAPGTHLYTTPGSYAIIESIPGTCPASTTHFVDLYGPLSASSSFVASSCSPCNGSAKVSSVTGGDGIFTYAWSPSGGTAAQATGLCANTYTCTISNAKCGSTLNKVITVTAPAGPTTGIAASAGPTCHGLCTGTASVTASGGTGPGTYTYSWATSGSTTNAATGLCVGSNNCTVTDANGCSSVQAITLTEPATLTSSASAQTNILCKGSSTGSAQINPSGGTTNYTYSWTGGTIGGGQGTATATGLAAGTFTCTVTDAHACTTSQVYTLTEPAVILSTSQASQVNVNCKGSSTGTAQISAAGGAGGYAYVWSGGAIGGGQGTATATGLAAGTYTCTVTDANNCTSAQVYTITQPGTSLAISSQSSTVTGCGVSTGTATVSVSGGTGVDTYTWAPAPGAGQGTATATGLTASNYTVTVHDANGCPITQTYSITTAGGPSASLASSANAKCNVSCDGTATVNATGGTGAGTYTYSWSGGAGTLATASSLCAGTFTCTITDGNNCSITQTATITAPSVLAASMGSQTPATCNGASTATATVAVSGGTTNYTYSWTGGAIGGGQGTATATGLAPLVTYTCTVNDANNCVSSQTFVTTQPTVLTATASGSTQTGCGTAIGTATVTAGGGTGADTYTWSGGVIGGGQGTATATGLAAGTYTITVHDSKNCPASTTYNITSAGGPTASLASSANSKCKASCDGTASVTALGGTGAGTYTYSWSGGAGTAATATGLCANTYTCTITDANNCITTQNVTITEPAVLTASALSQTNVDCNGNSSASATASASGGTANYTYSWTGGTITTGQGTASASGLAQGTYTCNVTDANGCTANQTFVLSQPAFALSSTSAQTNVSCNGGSSASATVTPNGGTAGYTYSWSTATPNATATASGLPIGTYTCTISDANGCKTTQAVTITQPAVLSAIATPVSSTCNLNNGTASVAPAGGSPSYTYSWSSGGGTSSTTGLGAGNYSCKVTDSLGCTNVVNFAITNVGSKPVAVMNPSGTTAFCAGLSKVFAASGGTSYSWNTGSLNNFINVTTAGIYTVYVTNSCGVDSAYGTAVVNPKPVPVITGKDTLCHGDSVLLVASGGNSYSWSNGSTSAAIYASVTGNYTVAATNNCGTDSATLAVYVSNVTADFIPSATSGSHPLPVTFRDSSSASAITWSWSFGDGSTSTVQLGNSVTYNTPGIYTVTLTTTNAQHCTSTHTEIITITDINSFVNFPNVFTPNGDGVNDVFVIPSAGLTDLDVKVYDRWGVEMAHMMAPGSAWDGTTPAGLPASNGTYYYTLHAKGEDGKAFDFTGFIMLIRTQ